MNNWNEEIFLLLLATILWFFEVIEPCKKITSQQCQEQAKEIFCARK